MQSIRRTAPGLSPVVGEQMRLPSQMEPVVPLSAQLSGSLQTGSGGMQRGITYVGWQFSEWLCLLVAARPGITDFRVLRSRGGRRVLRHWRPRGGIADPGRGDREPAGTAAVVCPDQPGSSVWPAPALHALAQGRSEERRVGKEGG